MARSSSEAVSTDPVHLWDRCGWLLCSGRRVSCLRLLLAGVLLGVAGCGESASTSNAPSPNAATTAIAPPRSSPQQTSDGPADLPPQPGSISDGPAVSEPSSRPPSPDALTAPVSPSSQDVVLAEQDRKFAEIQAIAAGMSNEALAEHRIRRYQSERMTLYSDIEESIAGRLPDLVDGLYKELVAYFGPPVDPAPETFRTTGYLMRSSQRFENAGLLTDSVPEFLHGRQWETAFWMNDQQQGYYRRHLFLHEATHCYMAALPIRNAPRWYHEGIAELFGTHRFRQDGTVMFRQLPDDEVEFRGHGRINTIRQDLAANGIPTLAAVRQINTNDLQRNTGYAYAWAFCLLLDQNPRYAPKFHELAKDLGKGEFREAFDRIFAEDLAELSLEWRLFAESLQAGFDVGRAAVVFEPRPKLLPSGETQTTEIRADRGWQSTGLRVTGDGQYRIRATGRFQLAETTRPWVSGPR